MAELILSCGIEGGGLDLYAHIENDTTFFHVSGSAMYLDENDEEAWRSWKSESVTGWENALQVFHQYHWYVTSPSYIHPAYRAKFLAVVLAQKNNLPNDLFERWVQHCQNESAQL